MRTTEGRYGLVTRWRNYLHDLDYEECLEYNFFLPATIKDARRCHRELLAWLDIADAFEFIPHQHIFWRAQRACLPNVMIETLKCLYEGASTSIIKPEGPSEPIPFLSGVKQGSPLSPILFNLTIESILRTIKSLNQDTAHKIINDDSVGGTINELAYADDLVLLARTESAPLKLLDVSIGAARLSGLVFQPSKYATLHINRQVLPTNLTIKESELRSQCHGEHSRHLDVPTVYRKK